VLSLLPKLCSSAWQTGQHYDAARKPGRRLTSTSLGCALMTILPALHYSTVAGAW
jgi:hypothetical protein